MKQSWPVSTYRSICHELGGLPKIVGIVGFRVDIGILDLSNAE
jgi:hypothetical protein